MLLKRLPSSLSSLVLPLVLPLVLVGVAACAPTTFEGDEDADIACGNGVVEVGESCDDGNTEGSDGCSADCNEESFRCGNGIIEANEDCDDGNGTPGDGCDSGCTLEFVCGDGFVAGDEECDDGNTSDDDGCSANCQLESACGDGEVDEGEECDDGNVDAGDGCDADCLVEEAAESVCGDGQVDADEVCDDGNLDSGDGCSATCETEALFCAPQISIGCNMSDSWSTTDFGSTDQVDNYACSAFDESGREYTYRFAPDVDTTMTIALTPESGVDLDLFLLSDDGNSLCEGGDCALYADNTVDVIFPGGSEYWIVVDGYLGAEGSYDIDFSCPTDPVVDCPLEEGNNGDSCADIYQGEDIWRCSTSSAQGGATVSQVCRDEGNGPEWITFHVDPTDCCACEGEFDVGCCTENSGSFGCPS